MDCRICMEQIKSIEFCELECGHSMCSSCLNRLVRNQCPYCRQVINNKIDGNYNFDYDLDDLNNYNENIEVDNILPLSEIYYIEELYDENSYDIIHANKIWKKKKTNRNRKKNFVSNKDRDEFQRKKKKWKKRKIGFN